MAVVNLRKSAAILRGDVYWVNLDPTVGTEIQKTRPALIVSPDDMNAALPRVLIAPITSKGQAMGYMERMLNCQPWRGSAICILLSNSHVAFLEGVMESGKFQLSEYPDIPLDNPAAATQLFAFLQNF